MPSAAGKRVERVLAGCSKPEAEISSATTWQEIPAIAGIPCQVSMYVRSETPPESEVTQDAHDTYLKVHMSDSCTLRTGIVIMRHVGIQELTWFTFSAFSPGIIILGL